MSLLRALRAYVGLGPDEDYEAGGLAPSGSYGLGDRRSMTGSDEYWNYGNQGAEPRRHRQSNGAAGGHHRPGRDRRAGVGRPSASQSQDLRLRHQEPSIDLRGERELHRSDFDAVEPDSADFEHAEFDAEGPDDYATDSDGAVVRSLDSVRARPKTVSPDSFADAKELADEFRLGVPVVLNLHGLERDLSRRLIDFASGVCYCMDGTMEKIGSGVFLLTPDGVEIAEEDRARIQQRGYAR